MWPTRLRAFELDVADAGLWDSQGRIIRLEMSPVDIVKSAGGLARSFLASDGLTGVTHRVIIVSE
jgi:hypothetical protein